MYFHDNLYELLDWRKAFPSRDFVNQSKTGIWNQNAPFSKKLKDRFLPEKIIMFW